MPDRHGGRRDIPALPFCHARLKGPPPLPPAYPQVLLTIGDHLRKRRLDLGLLQRKLAAGVNESTVTNWELNRTALDFGSYRESSPSSASIRGRPARRSLTNW